MLLLLPIIFSFKSSLSPFFFCFSLPFSFDFTFFAFSVVGFGSLRDFTSFGGFDSFDGFDFLGGVEDYISMVTGDIANFSIFPG